MSKVLIFTTELLPSLPYPAGGGGQRAYSLGEGLRSKGHQVIYSLPLAHLRGKQQIPDELTQFAHSTVNIDEIIAKVSPDVVLFATSYLMRFLSKSSVPIVLDLAANIELEAAFTPGSNLVDVLTGRLDQYAKADFFVIGSPRQIFWYSPFWMLAGLDLSADKYTVVPICWSPKLPPIPDRSELRFITAGMFYPWQDPFEALREVLSVLESNKKGSLYIFTGEHPTWLDIHSRLIDPISRLWESDRLKVKGLLPFDKLIQQWGKCSCAVDVMKPNLERFLASPMRTTTYLWLGIPVIISDFYWISQLVKDYEAGWLIDPSKKDDLNNVVQQVLDDPSQLRARAANAQRLVAENLTWDKCIAGLDRFCRSPSKAPKSQSYLAAIAKEIAKMYSDNISQSHTITRLQDQIEALKNESEKNQHELLERIKEKDIQIQYLNDRLNAVINSRTWRAVQFIKHKLLRFK